MAAFTQPAYQSVDLQELQTTVALSVSEVLGTDVSTDTPLMAAGVDSLGATELQRTLSEAFGVELPATLLFDHPSIGGIALFLLFTPKMDIVTPS